MTRDDDEVWLDWYRVLPTELADASGYQRDLRVRVRS